MFSIHIVNFGCLYVLLFVSSGESAGSDGIQIFHEGDDIPIKALIQHTVDEELKIAWYKGVEILSICSLSYGCSEYSTETETSLSELADEKYFESVITIKHASKKQCDLWTLKYLGLARVEKPGELYHCQISYKNTSKADIERNCKDPLTTLTNDNGYTSDEVIFMAVLVCTISPVVVLCSILCVKQMLPLLRKQKTHQYLKDNLKQICTNGFNVKVLLKPVDRKLGNEKTDSQNTLI
ncbi:uncharacterized protein LOC129922936 [Biomphalaria glabrata]|uniref:Uncharacterized protein LOC129922936 n=1 Tax=Biomphalaria glabrata TaxID=6526 RepID=A0A9W2YWU0_BIOGL|nr:uncharacterized protein LOC129922936 [Biomphalaria glabrata]XP_055867180.1 uncharacterized protein LOC129922936 [Biomphalaria glabrata]XP_055867181.1 uncharacterized protein LOC129922936 [Biomphalaria glabrata]XP_055867182.1 uncharacterized protein LOC129922936 [Biomphalaria glabrata]XP_055867183.1 uncharacterized protein LOC129922936 [Biomphalaria glabrata]